MMQGAVMLHGLVPAHTSRMHDAPAHTLVPGQHSTALVSAAPPGVQDLGADAVSALALHHHAVLSAYCVACAVLPMRFGAVFSATSAMQMHLDQSADQTRIALQTLAGLREFTVRLTVVGEPAVPVREVVTGRDFLARGRDLRNLRTSLSDRRTALARQLLDRLGALARQLDAAAAPRPERILDLALLVPHAGVPHLNALSQDFGPLAAALGLRLLITGPWPAYSFKIDQPEACHGA